MGKRKLPPAILRIERMSDGGEWRDPAALVDDFTGEVIAPKLRYVPKQRGPLESADSIQMRGHRAKAEAYRRLLVSVGLVECEPLPGPKGKGSVRLQVRYRRGPGRRI